MRSARIALILVLAAVAFQAFVLHHELAVGRVNLNDNVLHATLTARTAEALAEGENPFDFWGSEWTLGYPVPRTYQPLGHLAAAALHLVLGSSVDLATLLGWVRFLLLCLWPATVYLSARWLALSPRTAAAAALLSPWVTTEGLFGLEYGSYLWRGSGLYTQSWGMHLLALSLGLAWQAVRRGRRLTLAGLMLALTFLAHFIYGYMGALSIVLLALLPGTEPLARRLVRLGYLGAVSFALTAFHLVPLLADAPMINRSRWEPAWKWDSFGAREVAGKLLTGELLDFGRWPSLSLLALAGAAVVAAGRLTRRAPDAAEGAAGAAANRLRRLAERLPRAGEPDALCFLLAGAALWLLLFCGRPAWGPLLTLLGAGETFQLHRLIGGAHFFLILLAGAGLGSLWGLALERRRGRPAAVAAALVATALLLAPVVRERARFLEENRRWGEDNLAAYRAEETELGRVLARAAAEPGRIYAGLGGGWGKDFRIGSVPLYGFLSGAGLPAVSYLYHAMALTSDLMVHFDQRNPAHYRLFNVSTVVTDARRPMPGFLTPVADDGRFRTWRAPPAGYFELVAVPYAAGVDRRSFYDVNKRWLDSGWLAQRQHLLLGDEAPAGVPAAGVPAAGVPALPSGERRPAVAAAGALGTVEAERRQGETYSAEVTVERPAFLLFKMTYHRNWRVRVNGEARETVMLSPGFLGVALEPGRHTVECRYRAEGWKTLLLILALPLPVLLGWAERRGLVARAEERALAFVPRLAALPGWGWTALGLAALAAPVCVALAGGRMPGGHDAFVYLPRVVEFDASIRQGVLPPRWAPDLSSGYGQPLFLFAPPLIYALGTFGMLVGLGPVAALNLACALLVLAAAASMYLLGKHYFGRAGGVLAAAAYVYAPYFHTDLYVRRALAELTALALVPLALYGLARHAGDRRRRFLLLAAAGVAAVVASHLQSALMMTPLAAAFAAFHGWRARSWRLLAGQGATLAVGLGLAAWIWLPILAHMDDTKITRAAEGYLHYSNHFVHARQLLVSPWGYGLSVAGDGDGMSFALGWAHLLLIAAGWLLAARYRDAVDRWWWRFWFGVLVAACLLTLPASRWLWDHLPLLPYVQFPWRLLAPATFATALLAASLAAYLPRLAGRRLILGGAMALLVLANVGHARPERHHDVDPEHWTPGALARRGVSVTTSREFEPRWAEAPQPWGREPARVITGSAEILAAVRAPERWTVEVRARSEARIELALYYFPGWTVTRAGEPVAVEIAPGSGLLRFRTPPGEHRFEVRFATTPARRLGTAVSLLAAGLALALTAGGRSRRLAAIAVLAGLIAAATVLAPLLARRQPVVAIAAPDPSGRPNILLISVDTLRADHLGAYGYPRPTSPFLDSLAASGVRFDNAFAQASWTLPSHMSLLTSTYPQTHGVETEERSLGATIPTLAEVLHAGGYETTAFVSWIFLKAAYGFGRGFERFEELLPPAGQVDSSTRHSIKAEAFAEEVAHWARQREAKPSRPYFLFLHLFDPHMSYQPPLALARRFAPGLETLEGGSYGYLWRYVRGVHPRGPRISAAELEVARALYDGEIRYVDDALARLFDVLEGEGLLENTMIVFTSDHGEELDDHGSMEGHQWTLYDEVLQVPLLIVFPDGAHRGRTVPQVVQSIDVAPTLLEVAGLDAPAAFEGRSLLPLLAPGGDPDWRGFAFSQIRRFNLKASLRTAEHKLIYTQIPTRLSPSGTPIHPGFEPYRLSPEGGLELYDLRRDPGELADVYSSGAPAAGTPAAGTPAAGTPAAGVLVERLRALIAGARASDPGEAPELSPQELERLRSLGYLP